MSDTKKFKGFKTGLLLIVIALAFIAGSKFEEEAPIIWACITAEGLRDETNASN